MTMRYEVHINGDKVVDKKGTLSHKKLQEYLILNDLLLDDIDYNKEEVVVYKLKDNPNKGYGWGV